MTTIEITNRDDLRVGDVATFAYNGHEFSGPLWTEGSRTLYVGDALVRYTNGNSGPYEFVRASREAPSLPTEPGSVILVSECRGERVDPPAVAVLNSEAERWYTGTYIDCHVGHLPEHITEWTEARVVSV